jgi:hypothetical protein
MFYVYQSSTKVLGLCVYSVAAMIVIQSSIPPPYNNQNNQKNPLPIFSFLVSQQEKYNKKNEN